jgi:hypothetical protein
MMRIIAYAALGTLTLEPLKLLAADSNVQFERKKEVESLPSSCTKTKQR